MRLAKKMAFDEDIHNFDPIKLEFKQKPESMVYRIHNLHIFINLLLKNVEYIY